MREGENSLTLYSIDFTRKIVTLDYQNSSCQIYFYEHEILKRTYSLSVRDKNIATDEINKWLLLKKYKPIRKGG
mgnify:FL=1